MTPRQDAIEPFVRLRQRISEVLARHGLDVTQVLFSADDPTEIHIRTRVVETPPVSDGFDEVIASAHAAEVERRAEEARRSLEEEMGQWFDR